MRRQMAADVSAATAGGGQAATAIVHSMASEGGGGSSVSGDGSQTKGGDEGFTSGGERCCIRKTLLYVLNPNHFSLPGGSSTIETEAATQPSYIWKR